MLFEALQQTSFAIDCSSEKRPLPLDRRGVQWRFGRTGCIRPSQGDTAAGEQLERERERERERASLRRILESIDRKSEEKFHHSSSPFPGPSILQQIEREAVVPLEDVRA